MHHDESAAPTYDVATPPEQLIARITHLEARLAEARAAAEQCAAALAAAEAGRRQAEEAAASAQAQADRYQELVDNLSVVTYRAVMDTVTPPDYVSPYIQQLLGYTPAEWSAASGLWLSLIHPEDAPQVLASMAEAGRRETLLAREYRMQHRAGHWVWVREQASVVATADGAPPVLIGLLFEITKRKQAEDALRESEERLRTMLSGMPIMLDAFDDQQRLVVWNAECERVTGYSADELIGRADVLAILYPDQAYREGMLAEWGRRHGNFRNWELTLTRKDGEQRIVAWSNVSTALPVPGWSFWAVGVDVTEQRRIEAALRASEERLRLALDVAAMVVWEWERTTDETIWIGDPVRTFQISRASVDSMHAVLQQHVHPADLAAVLQAADRAEQHHEIRIEFRYIRDDGGEGWIESHTRAVPQQGTTAPRLVGVSRDISERKRFEETQQRQARIQETLNGALHALHSHGHDQLARYRILTTAVIQLCQGLAASHIQLWERDEPDSFRLIVATNASGVLTPSDDRLGIADLPAAARENLLAEPLIMEPIAIPALDRVTGAGEHYYLLAFHWRNVSWGFMAIGMAPPGTLSREDLTLAATIGEIMRTTVRRWLAVDALQESERRMRMAIEAAQLGSWELVIATERLTISDSNARIMGLGDQAMTLRFDRVRTITHPDDRALVEHALTAAIATGAPIRFDQRIRHPDGAERIIEIWGQVRHHPDGYPERIVGVVRDVTEQRMAQAAIEQSNADLERRVAERTQELAQANLALRQEIAERTRAEQALHESRRFLERVLWASPARVSIFDYTTRTIIYSSSSFTTQLGYSAEELELMGGPFPLDQLIHPEDLARLPAQVQRQMGMADDEVFEREFRMRHADGSWRWFETRDVIFSRDTYGVPTQVLGQIFDITARKRTELALAESLAQRDTLNADLRQANLALRQEIAERARAEQALRESQRFIERVMAASPAQVYVFDYNAKRVIFTNRSMAELIDLAPESRHHIGAYPIELLMHPDDAERIPAIYQAYATLSDDEAFENEFRLQGANGSWRWFASRDIVFTRRADGGPEQMLGASIDITARKEAEARLSETLRQLEGLNADLQRTSSLLSTIINSLDDGLVLIGADGRVLMINQAVAAICRMSPAQIVGRAWDQLCPFHSPQIDQALRDGLAFSGREHLEIEGSTRLFDVQVLPLPTLDAGQQLVLHLVDVTERLRFEELAIQNERLASTGRLAAVVAHEVNSPLQAIQNFLFLAATDDPSERDRHLAMVSDEIDRVGGLIRRLLDLQRPADATVRQIDAGTLIERVLALVRSTLKRHRVQVVQDLVDEPALVMGRSDQLTQVLLNLLMNALDAMPHGGELRLRLWLDRPNQAHAEVAAQQVLIEVADTGQGIPDAALPRIFEQFYTTKASGSGLGLAISRQIVEQHGGQISAANRSPCGAVFTVRLPAADPGRLYASPTYAAQMR